MNTDTETPSVAVVLVNWNNEDDTLACLETLADQTLDSVLTIVVDNGSEPESFEAIKDRFEFPVYLRNSTNRGFTGGNNRGIQYALEAGADWILLLNNDTEIEPTFLEDLVTAADDLPDDAGIVGPKIHTYDSRDLWAAGGEIGTLSGATRHRPPESEMPENPERVDYVVGAALLVRDRVFRDVGLLDDDFFIYYEETEFCVRARKGGWTVWFVPVEGVYHKESVDYSFGAFREYYFTRNRFLFVTKTQPARIVVAFSVYYLVRWVLLQVLYLLVVERDVAASKATLRGAKDALVGATGKRKH